MAAPGTATQARQWKATHGRLSTGLAEHRPVAGTVGSISACEGFSTAAGRCSAPGDRVCASTAGDADLRGLEDQAGRIAWSIAIGAAHHLRAQPSAIELGSSSVDHGKDLLAEHLIWLRSIRGRSCQLQCNRTFVDFIPQLGEARGDRREYRIRRARRAGRSVRHLVLDQRSYAVAAQFGQLENNAARNGGDTSSHRGHRVQFTDCSTASAAVRRC